MVESARIADLKVRDLLAVFSPPEAIDTSCLLIEIRLSCLFNTNGRRKKVKRRALTCQSSNDKPVI